MPLDLNQVWNDRDGEPDHFGVADDNAGIGSEHWDKVGAYQAQVLDPQNKRQTASHQQHGHEQPCFNAMGRAAEAPKITTGGWSALASAASATGKSPVSWITIGIFLCIFQWLRDSVHAFGGEVVFSALLGFSGLVMGYMAADECDAREIVKRCVAILGYAAAFAICYGIGVLFGPGVCLLLGTGVVICTPTIFAGCYHATSEKVLPTLFCTALLSTPLLYALYWMGVQTQR